jgi:hypothetical protein
MRYLKQQMAELQLRRRIVHGVNCLGDHRRVVSSGIVKLRPAEIAGGVVMPA